MSQFIYQSSIKDNIPTKLDPRSKLAISFTLFLLILYIRDLFELTIVLCFVLSLGVITMGIKSILQTVWYLKYYFLIFALFFLLYSSDTWILMLTGIKLLGLIFSFVLLSRTTNPDQLVDALIKLKLPPSLAWNIGVAIRQAIFLLDEISHIIQIHRQRLNYGSMNKLHRFRFRIYEVYILLQAVISRSIVISSDFTDALYARGYQKPTKEIITYPSSFSRLDMLFIFIYIVIPLAILSILRHQFFIIG